MADSCKPCKDVSPFPLSSCKDPLCSTVSPEGEFVLSSSERQLFDSVAAELNKIVGTTISYYHLDIHNSKRDALYDEPVATAWLGPYKIIGYVVNPDGVPEVREEGFKKTWESTVWIARSTIEEANVPTPHEGDVLRIWDTPFENLESALRDPTIPNSGMYFDVVEVDPDGRMFDNPEFVGFRLVIRRRSEFTPERRVVPP